MDEARVEAGDEGGSGVNRGGATPQSNPAAQKVTRRGLVPRERLTSKLLAATDASIALVVAPAGYGKTTVLAQWDAADERPFVWIHLNDSHNDPPHLLGSIARAVDGLGLVDQGVFNALSAPRPSISKVVVPRLVESLADFKRPFVLVLDDVQVIDHPVSLNALSALGEQVPPSIQLALAARSEPEIRIGRLRANRRLVELRPSDLVMTRSEAAQLVRAAGLEVGPGAVKRLVERTEGWPAALYLATVALRGSSEASEAIERFAGDDRMVADYLRDEFLARQSPDDLDFLTATSILDRLTGSLCDAVLQREGSGETLRRLSRSNLLLVPLDRKDEQYRYHALLSEMLQSELHQRGDRPVSELHARASQWYAEQGELDHAIPHAISAGNLAEAGRLIWAMMPEYESHGREATMRRWLDRFTEKEVATSPYLCVARAANHATRGDGAQCERWASAALSAIANEPEGDRELLDVAAAVIRAAGAARDGVVQMGLDASRGNELMPEDGPWRALCSYLIGTAHHLQGERERARTELEEAARRGAAALPNIQTLALGQLALLALDEGEQDTAATLVLRATTEADAFGLKDYPTSALLFAISALVRARRGRVEDATRHLERSARLLGKLTEFSPWYEAETRVVLAGALLLLDDVPPARAHLADAMRYLRQTPDAVVLEEWLTAAQEKANSVEGLGGWPLTKAELRLLHFLPTHLSYREISEQLFVSTNTVRTHAQAVYRKLGVSSRAEAVASAQAAGLIRSGEAPPAEPH